MKVVESERLILRWASEEDASFIQELVNDPAWLQYLGDRGIRTIDEARHYIQTSLMGMYEKYGFGLYMVELKENGDPVGICGLLKRDSLEHVDIGFAFSSTHHRKGYGYESAQATLKYAKESLSLTKIVAITSTVNTPSSSLLEKLGFTFERMVKLPHDPDELKLYGIHF